MINKVMSAAVPKVAQEGGRLKKFLQSESLGKVLDTAADNPVICQSGFSLALCCVARPVTNFIVTEDKQDATYASCHSISSGLIGFVWPLIFATPLAAGVKKVLANPQKFLKPEMIKKFYPNVAVVDEIGKDGKKIGEKIKTNAKGEMLRKDGSVLCKDLEPKMIYVEEEKAAFEKANAGFYVDKGGVVRSKTVFKTEGGKVKLDEEGNKVGCAVQKDLTPITEEMEIGEKKEKNVQNLLNMVPDIMLAPPRAALTIALIPSVLKNVFGVQKGGKSKSADVAKNTVQKFDVVSKSNNALTASNGANTVASTFASFKKGGV